ncbi:ubiquinol-cytochrome C chaperone family protein [Sphingosinicella sp.]|uniref:ubiquinol-cytochrome C chaperone family protein n=1 Tax=Sphingosinicella sp. TaxID=1917971 RepID=UPI0040380B29
MNALSLISRLFRAASPRETLDPLYRAIVAAGRDPGWYRDGGVPDTIDGRFDMIAALTALVLLRLETEEAGRQPSVLLTELFIADMDSSLRQIGIGDYVVGKHVGRMMGALGGRLAALREAGDRAALTAVVERNIFRGEAPSPEALALVSARLDAFRTELAAKPLDQVLAGTLPDHD